MRKTLKARITDALVRGEKVSKNPDAYPFLPEIQQTLKAMLAGLTMAPTERERLSGALGRLVTEDYGFSESNLGTTLLELADDFASRTE
ncbi:MAG: hypothetical protein ACYC3I_26735 [Gemmataceae bacterium]